MKNTFNRLLITLFVLLFFGISNQITAQSANASDIYFYKKQEQNIGLKYNASELREEIYSPEAYNFDELTKASATFYFNRNLWNFLDYKQEELILNAEIGPFWGSGNFVDSSFYQYIVADQNISGITSQANVSYQSRYYWDRKNYTIVDVSGWGRYNLFKQNADGTIQDSNRIESAYDVSENEKKFRYGLQAKAGWGIGRLNPMNNFMIADYLLNKYFAGRNFSEEEILKFADEIARIKSERSIKTTNNYEREADQLNQFVRNEFLLTPLTDLNKTLVYSEFLPRFNGARTEVGPYFNYFNREPDFVYGGYLKYENEKYINTKWNRKICAALQYNRYKRQDWVLAEINIGASLYNDLRSRFDLGFKYVPGVVINNFEDVEPLVHNFIPYFSYFTQINSKMRIEADALLRINDNEQFMAAGPEFTLKVFWSKY